jgi:hypothetical protein
MSEVPPSPEDIEGQIEQLIGELDDFALDQFPAEAQDALADEWYDVEMEAKVGADRAHALAQLEQFVGKLRSATKKEE